MKNNDMTEELKKLCDNKGLSLELVDELIQAEKGNLGNKGISHKSMIESLIKKYTN